MRDKIEQIKGLLAELEKEASDKIGQQFTKNYNALELPIKLDKDILRYAFDHIVSEKACI